MADAAAAKMGGIPVLRQCSADGFNLFCCIKDPAVCLGTWCCPCNTAGHLAKKVREQIVGGPLWENVVVGCCCGACALCQEAGKTGTDCSELLKVGECTSSAKAVVPQQGMK